MAPVVAKEEGRNNIDLLLLLGEAEAAEADNNQVEAILLLLPLAIEDSGDVVLRIDIERIIAENPELILSSVLKLAKGRLLPTNDGRLCG